METIYIDSILKEIDIIKNIPHCIETIYIGGGTPSVLSYKALEKLLKALLDNFKIAKAFEFSIEINPATIDKEKIKLMKEFQINRISVGVQSFNKGELKILGRIHTAEDSIDTVENLAAEGFENISIDLIYGIPGQSIESWQKSLETAIKLSIKHFSAYELSLQEGTELERDIKFGRLRLLKDEEVADMYEIAFDFAETREFLKYEISNFAIQGFECKHNIAYWKRKPYIGIGPSAHSFVDRKRFHNPANLSVYVKALSENKTAWVLDSTLTSIEELKEKIFLGLRMKEGIFIYDKHLFDLFEEFESQGLIFKKYPAVNLTNKGMLLSNEIFARVLLHIENCPVCKQGLTNPSVQLEPLPH